MHQIALELSFQTPKSLSIRDYSDEKHNASKFTPVYQVCLDPAILSKEASQFQSTHFCKQCAMGSSLLFLRPHKGPWQTADTAQAQYYLKARHDGDSFGYLCLFTRLKLLSVLRSAVDGLTVLQLSDYPLCRQLGKVPLEFWWDFAPS